jgi:hypothetical protein
LSSLGGSLLGCAVIFACFRIDAEYRNLKRTENEMLQSETETNLFPFNAKKVLFSLFSHMKRNENEMKPKQNEKEAKT